MSTIVTRAGKGSPLTHTEVDNNFTNLNTDKYQSGDNVSVGTLSATGVATFSAGTVSAPAITTSGDTNTGIYFPAADTIAFTEGGVESMRIDSSGNVGIGTSSPATTLDVTHSNGGRVRIRGVSADGARLEFFNNAATTNGFVIGQGFGSGTDNIAYISNQAAADMILRTAATERMRIDSAGNVGIGGTPAAGRSVTVNKNITGAASSYGLFSFGIVQSDVTTEAVYFRSASQTAAASFSTTIKGFEAVQGTFGVNSTVTNQYGFIAGANLTGATNNYGFFSNIASGTGRWNFYANGTAANYFAGTVQNGSTISVGNATPSTSGVGITFPATQSASSDANTLDDYEEGTWTPSLGGNTTYNANGQYGQYVKIGKMVSISGIIDVNTIGTGSATTISGLPFTVSVNGQGSIGFFTGLATSLVFVQPFCDTNNNQSLKFRTLTAAGTAMGTANIFQNGTRIDFSVVYYTT